jgi:DNA-binding CsgD family transcriptional regulator
MFPNLGPAGGPERPGGYAILGILSGSVLEREAVTQAVDEVLLQARSGRGGSLFVIGHAGLGKTELFRLAASCGRPDMQVGVARGDVLETALPFGLIAQLVDSLGGGEADEPAGPSASVHDARATRFYRTFRWLQALAAGRPVLLVVDDLHWGDGDSVALLSYLCRRLDTLPVAVMATLRPWPPSVEAVCRALAVDGHGRVVHLEALSRSATRALLVDRIGPWATEELVERAYAATAGNPLLLEQVAASVTADDGYPTAAVVAVPRFGGLTELGLRVARAASVLGDRFDPGLAVALAGLADHEAEAALAALDGSGLVGVTGVGAARFTHPYFRQALYDDLPPLVRQQLHGRAFRLLLQKGADLEAAEHAVLGNLSGDGDAVRVLTSAGRAALRLGGHDTAIRRLEAASRLAGTSASPELLLLLGEALVAGGRTSDAVDLFKTLTDRADLGCAERVEALRMLGRSLFMAGDVVHGRARLVEAAATAGSDRPELAVPALLDESRAAWLTGGPVAALPAVEKARDMAAGLDEAVRTEAEAAWGFVAFASGDPAGLGAATAAGSQAPADGAAVMRDLWWNWGTRRNSGRAAKYAERFEESESVFRAMFAHAEHSGSPHAIVSLAAHHAETLARQGRLEEALGLSNRATALGELAPMADAFAYAVDALLSWHLGRPEESEAYCRRAEKAGTDHGEWLPLLRVVHLRAVAAAHRGDLDRACDLYRRLADETARLGIGEPCLVPWARYAIVAHQRAGDLGQAERVLRWVAGCAERLPCRWPRIAAHAGRASLAEARGDDDAADAEFRRALALHEEVPLPLERIETLQEYGGFLRRCGRLTDARAALRDALATAEAIGARALAQSVEAELAVAGGRRRRRHASAGELTAQEQRVARLAAAGHSCAEIAADLSLSMRTIETHLGRIYAKLGVHSQRELMVKRSQSPG